MPTLTESRSDVDRLWADVAGGSECDVAPSWADVDEGVAWASRMWLSWASGLAKEFWHLGRWNN